MPSLLIESTDSMISSNYSQVIASSGRQQYAVGVWERSLMRQDFVYNFTYDDGRMFSTLARYDEPNPTTYHVNVIVV